jgi:meso-butanediol dehydrogenase/(S,S)-butanediol dehydrogenase/diacetyl reductase
MHGRLHGKIALILEGDGEIAAATAVRFAREGARLALCGRDGERLEETATAVADVGGSAYVLQADAAHETQISAVLDEVVSQFGTLDVIVCCPNEHGASRTTAEPAARKAMLTMAARGGGSIVIVARPASGSGPQDGDESRPVLESLVRRLALEGAPRAVRANLLAPGLVGTERFLGTFDDSAASKAAEEAVPLGRFAQPDEIAGAIAFLSSEDAAYLTGVTVIVDGGCDARHHESAAIED